MSVADRNFSTKNEVRAMMTSTAFPIQSSRGSAGQRGLELLISHLAVSMLRWSERSAERRLTAHERLVLMRETHHDSAATDFARMVKHVRLG